LRSSNFESLMGGSICRKQSKTAMNILRTTINRGSEYSLDKRDREESFGSDSSGSEMSDTEVMRIS
jgi:hypothetical protein